MTGRTRPAIPQPTMTTPTMTTTMTTTKRTTLILGWATLLLGPIAVAQETTPAGTAEGVDWRMPFRSPASNVAPPDCWVDLRPMYEIARDAAPEQRSFDANGTEVIDDPVWRQHHDAFVVSRIDAGYLSVILRDSRHISDRAIAFYGSFYVPDPSVVLQLVQHIPGEPARGLREDAYRRAAEYVRVHLPTRVDGDLDAWSKTRPAPGGGRPPRPGTYVHPFDPTAFVALLGVDDWRDYEQALWFLSRCTESRKEVGLAALDMGHALLRNVIATGRPSTRQAAQEFVALLDPVADRKSPTTEAPSDDWLAWYAAAVHDIFPPLRRISEGLFELYPSADLDDLVRVGTAALKNGSLGTDGVSGTNAQGGPFRGFRLETLPAPLDQLGLEHGFTITSINGVPSATAAAMLKLFEKSAARTKRFVVEFVDRQGAARAIEYRRR